MEHQTSALAPLERLALDAAACVPIVSDPEDLTNVIARPLFRLYEVAADLRYSPPAISSVKTLSSLHPWFGLYRIYADDQNGEMDGVDVLRGVAAALRVDVNDIQSWRLKKRAQPGTHDHMTIVATDDLQTFSREEHSFYLPTVKLEAELERVKTRVREQFLRQSTEESGRLYLQKKYLAIENFYQGLLNRTGTKAVRDLFPFPSAFDAHDRLRLAIGYFEQLLHFMAIEFGQFINADLPAPCHAIARRQESLREQLAVVAPFINHTFDVGVRAILLEPIVRLTHAGPAHRPSCNELDYSERYVNRLFALIKPGELNETNLAQTLVELNLNSTAFIYYRIAEFRRLLEASPAPARQMSTLYGLVKDVEQRMIIPHPAFLSDRSSAGEQLLQWLKSEINCLELQITLAKTLGDEAALPARIPTKITAQVSVGKLALMFMLLKDVKFIATETKTDLFRFIAENFRTRNKETISFKSISAKSYEPEPGAIEGVKKILEAMILLLRK